MTRQQAADHFGITRALLTNRINKGVTGDALFAKPEPRSSHAPGDGKLWNWRRYVTPYGHLRIRQICEHIGLSENGLWQRLYSHGYSEREAFNTPRYGKPGKDFILSDEEYTARTDAVRARIKEDTGTQN